MVTLSKKQLILLVLALFLVASLPLAVFLSQGSLDIRPRALQGNANLLLSPDTTNIAVGGQVNVLVSMQLTDSRLRVSGADLTIVYDKNLLEVVSIQPEATLDPNGNVYPNPPLNPAFVQAILVSSGGIFDVNNNFLRVVVSTNTRPNDQLRGGTVQVARVTFRGLAAGSAVIKYPDDNSKLEIVGISI